MNLPDPRNKDIVVFVDGELVHATKREFPSLTASCRVVMPSGKVCVSITVALPRSMGTWNVCRIRPRRWHFEDVPSSDEVRDAMFRTLAANRMRDETHIRLTLTRGEKTTSGMNTRLNQSGCTLIVLAEWKPPVYSDDGIRVITASTRRNTPQCLDSKIHHNNLLNNILASIEANVARVDSAIMLDIQGFVSETNDTNLFIVHKDCVSTPCADSCLPGLTRQMVLDICRTQEIPVHERNISLSELYTADEVFTSGTMGELTPVLEADGRQIADGKVGVLTKKLQQLHREFAFEHGTPLPTSVNPN